MSAVEEERLDGRVVPGTSGLAPAGRRIRVSFVAAAVAAVVADQVADWVVRAADRPVQVVDGLLRLTPSTNDGIAFGLLQGTGPLPLVLGVVVLGLVVGFALDARTEPPVQWALGLLVGGAVANLIERVAYGAVLDYVDLGIGTMRWPTFNGGDMAISLAVAIIVVNIAAGSARARAR